MMESYPKIGRRSDILNQICCQSSFVAICLVMEIHHLGLWEQVTLLLNEMLNCRNVWESLHSELAVEATAQSIKNLVFFLRAMPN